MLRGNMIVRWAGMTALAAALSTSVAALNPAGAQTAGKEFVLSCTGDTGKHRFLISEPSNSVTYLSDNRLPVGRLKVNGDEYRILFPREADYLEAHAIINRHSGKMLFSQGSPPFTVFNKNNHVWTAVCDMKYGR